MSAAKEQNTADKLVQRVSGKAVIEAEGAILILHPSGIDANRNWHIPGGIRDDISESVRETAVREAIEETGIDLNEVEAKVFKVGEWKAVDKGEQVKITAIFFHFKLTKRPAIVLSDEHDDFAWIDNVNYKKYTANQEVYEIVDELLV